MTGKGMWEGGKEKKQKGSCHWFDPVKIFSELVDTNVDTVEISLPTTAPLYHLHAKKNSVE